MPLSKSRKLAEPSPPQRFAGRKEPSPLLAADDGSTNRLAKVTDGARSRWRSAVTEAQEALSSNAVFIEIKSPFSHGTQLFAVCLLAPYQAAEGHMHREAVAVKC
ncbi:unnamed protein product [Pleuronectes platessa]|uniref:Uncharacterized protein n=1 Tax=Pleuronectes platessa TaxID=8262 RepID=A0A9N7YJG2_PLEPL|nr:unnamed protein product [Pleuronectes platessa]